MKFIVEQSALADCVNWVSRSLSTRPIKTELLGIVIDATGSNVELSGSDLETSSKANFAAQIIEAGKVLVPGKLLVEITRSLPNKPITITDKDGLKYKVLIVDSEGIGAFNEDQNHDTRIFLLALLLSSYFIYNSMGTIDENAL